MSSEKTAMDAPITQEIEDRLKDLGVEDKSQETTKEKADGAPAHMQDEKKESDLEDKSEVKTGIDKVEEKKSIDEDKCQETTKETADGAPAHTQDEKKESDVEDKSEVKTEIDKVKEKKSIDVDKVLKEDEKDEEVDVASVDHRTYAGDEGKTEDVPVTIVHEIHGKKEEPSSGILYTVGTKVLTTATGIKDTIVDKYNRSK